MGQDTDVELAAVKEQLKAIRESIDDVKVGVTKLLSIDRTVAEMKVRQEGHEEKINKLMSTHEELERSCAENTAYLNKLRGAYALAVAIASIVQVVIFGGAGWLVTTVIDSREEVRVIHQSIRHLESGQDRLFAFVNRKVQKKEASE